jgi:hypothetical protein
MEHSDFREKISRYEYCHPELRVYLEKVLLRIPEEVRLKEVLDDLTFEIISFDAKETCGQYYPTSVPLKHIIILNESILTSPDYNIIHTIVHEIAHKVAGKGETGLREMEAEELLIKWGFKEESEKVNYYRPIAESTGFEAGYKWAKKQDDLSPYEKYYDKWNSELITNQEWADILEDLDIISIISDIPEDEGTEVNISIGDLKDSSESSDSGSLFPMDSYFDKGVVQGVMSYIKEKKIISRIT